MAAVPTPHTRCPTCSERGPWLGSPTAPFCSDRCKLIDFGRWANQSYTISEPLRPEHFREYEEIPDDLDPDEPESI
ncbi:MAG: DNA gyrase inhibitor YacG [Puniceicoccaceae bacterium]|nr:MAG: DNA gyrase inhibitor YacG [Puniceicoccaceae bacterium]